MRLVAMQASLRLGEPELPGLPTVHPEPAAAAGVVSPAAAVAATQCQRASTATFEADWIAVLDWRTLSITKLSSMSR